MAQNLRKKTKAPKKSAAVSGRKRVAAAKKDKNDIIQLILEDHKPLKRLIKVLKNSDKSFEERQMAFDEFAPLLVAHAKPEEESLYIYMKGDDELREEGLEGDVEHGLADQMLEEAKRTEDEDLWSARVKVLAELVEHHIEEEEEELLPDFRKHSSPEDRKELGDLFLMLKTKMLRQGGEDSPREDIDQPRH